MVAYSFHRIFAPQVEALTKCQTVRGERRRHARIGEPVQLYAGMRTRQCRKLIAVDPICDFVAPIRIYVPEPVAPTARPIVPAEQVRIEIMGRELDDAETLVFAIADGFGSVSVECEDKVWRGSGIEGFDHVSPVSCFGAWWWQDHGAGWWQGVLIRWSPAPEVTDA